MLTIDQLVQSVSREQVKASIYSALEALGLSTTSWQEGAVVRTIIAITSALFSGFSRVTTTVIRAQFLDTSEGPWLTLLAWFVYGVLRIEASFATGTLRFTNTGGGEFSFGVGEYLAKKSDGKTYTNTVPFTIAAFQEDVLVAMRATVAGSGSTAAPGQINEHVTTMLEVEVTNDNAIVGADAESDPLLRERCRLSLGALSPNGPRAAYVFVARTPSLVGSVRVDRVRVMPATGDGIVRVVVAGPSGALSPEDLALVDDGIQQWAVPEGVTATVENATQVTVSFAYEAWIQTSSGLSIEDFDALAFSKLVQFVSTIPIGGIIVPPSPTGKVSWRALVGQIEATSTGVVEAVLTPETDFAISTTGVPVLGSVAPTTHLVAA